MAIRVVAARISLSSTVRTLRAERTILTHDSHIRSYTLLTIDVDVWTIIAAAAAATNPIPVELGQLRGLEAIRIFTFIHVDTIIT